MADRLAADPHGNYIFHLEIDNVSVANLMEVSGLKTAAQVFEIEEGGVNGFAHKRPGASRYDNLVLRYASSDSTFMQSWRDAYMRDPFSRENVKSGSITLYDNNAQAVRRFHFTSAWPVSWEGPGLDASGSAVAVETLEVAHEGLTVSEG